MKILKLTDNEAQELIDAINAVIESLTNNGISPLVLMIIKKKLVEL